MLASLNDLDVKETRRNRAGQYAKQMVKSQVTMTDGNLWNDYKLLSDGHAIYLPHFFASPRDFEILKALSADMQKNGDTGMVNWSKHLKHENPNYSASFKQVVNKMAAYFDVDVYATRMNFYPDGQSWKPFHHDSHAYGGHDEREDFTMGASFGATRELVFKHEASGQVFSFPQKKWRYLRI